MLRSAASLALAGVLITGCATNLEPSRSGFMGDYSALSPDLAQGGLLSWRDPDADWGAYHSVVIDPPVMRVASVGPADGEALSAGLRQALTEAFSDRRRLVSRGGSGVLVVRTAVTEVVQPNRALNVVTGLLISPVSRGAAAGEAEIFDAATGRRLAALSWAGDGRIAEFTGFYQRHGHARGALRRFAAEVEALTRDGPEAAPPRDRRP